MTAKEACELINKSLRFGDKQQIDALEFIRLFEEIKDAEGTCIECEGTGKHTCECGDEHDCGECSGSGKYPLMTIKHYSLPELRRIALRKK